MFELKHKDPNSQARTGCLYTSHGKVETPVFMPVGTKGSVKAMAPEDLVKAGSQIVLGNTYHLYLRPGDQLVAKMGGLHRFMGWSGPILTDSGGFQVFSLSSLRTIDDDGVTFRSHIDGSEHRFTAERVMQIQQNLGADIIMCLDHCPDASSEPEIIQAAVQRTTDWAARCREAHERPDQALFGIVQGGIDEDIRRNHLQEIVDIGFDGYALGGLSVGEPKPDMYRIVRAVGPEMPSDSPRYLMGIGTPDAMIEAMRAGIDMFDCVHATRIARHGKVMTTEGSLTIRNAPYADDPRPLDENCTCHVCRTFSRAYIRHLIKSEELLAYHLTTYHNLWFVHRMMEEARQAICRGKFDSWRTEFYSRYYGASPPE